MKRYIEPPFRSALFLKKVQLAELLYIERTLRCIAPPSVELFSLKVQFGESIYFEFE